MDNKNSCRVSLLLARFRGWVQAGAALLTNLHLPNFFRGRLYQGAGKAVCVPGLNCYSCPAASGACPIGAFQAVVGSSKFRFSYYITAEFQLQGMKKPQPPFRGLRQRLSKNPFGLFRQFFAVCCAHNLFAIGEQIPHLQPEKCFRPRTRRGRKRF